MNDLLPIISSFIMFILGLAGILITRLIKHINWFYSMSFVSGSFFGLTLLHFIPEAVFFFRNQKYPIYSFIIIGIFAFFSLLESKKPKEKSSIIYMDISEMINQHYELVPSILMRVLISIFLFLHSIIIGIGITLNFATSTLNAQIIIATILERLCDSFTFAAFIGNNKINKVFYWILMSLYCLSTPAAIIGFNYSNTHIKINDNQDIIGALASVSAGAYIFVGVLFWRKCFLDPFEFKKKEYIVISLIFAFGIIIHTLTSIPSKS